jgi:hypothetical protein
MVSSSGRGPHSYAPQRWSFHDGLSIRLKLWALDGLPAESQLTYFAAALKRFRGSCQRLRHR